MSKYLQIKMLKALQGAESSDDVRGDVVSEGIDSLKKNISDYKTTTGYTPFLEKVDHTPNYQGSELAEVAIDVYRNNIKPKPESTPKPEDPVPVAAGRKYHMQAMAKSLAGMRNGGDTGRLRQDAGPNGGDMRVGDGRVIHTEETSIADMSVEEYQEYLSNKNTLVVEEVEEVEVEQELLVEDPVKDLEEALLEMKEHSWQSIDKVMRGICKEYDITPKQLHKDFKSAHGGQIPDDWAKSNQVTEECGWFPLNEVALNRRGHAFDVSMYWKGHYRRLKFFWPDLTYPKKSEMQKAAEMFYPGSKLTAFYPTREDNNDFMVLVPPMSENYNYVPMEEWIELNEEAQDILNQIEEDEGEIVSGVEVNDDGALTFFISDNETGEERQVIVEKTGDMTGHGSRLDTYYHYDMQDNDIKPKDIKNRTIKSGKKKKFKTEEVIVEGYVKRTESDHDRSNDQAHKHDVAYRKKLNPNADDHTSGKYSGEGEDITRHIAQLRDDPIRYKHDKRRVEIENRRVGKEKKQKNEEVIYEDDMKGMSQKSGDKRSTESGAGLTSKGVAKYRAKNPGSKLKTAVTTPPSKLKAGSKAAGRRKSFCARSRGWNGERGKAARKRWNC